MIEPDILTLIWHGDRVSDLQLTTREQVLSAHTAMSEEKEDLVKAFGHHNTTVSIAPYGYDGVNYFARPHSFTLIAPGSYAKVYMREKLNLRNQPYAILLNTAPLIAEVGLAVVPQVLTPVSHPTHEEPVRTVVVNHSRHYQILYPHMGLFQLSAIQTCGVIMPVTVANDDWQPNPDGPKEVDLSTARKKD